MKIIWSVPVQGERLESSRGDLVRARRLIEALRAEGVDVHVAEAAAGGAAATAATAYRRVVRQLVPRQPALMLRDAGRWAQARAHGRHVAALARARRADLIIETQVHFAGSGAVAARLTGRPLVLDDCSPSAEVQTLGAGLPGLAHRVFRRQLRAARALVVSSAALRERLAAEGVPPAKIHVVPNGVELAAYTHTDRAAVRARAGIDDACVIGFVGSFQPWHRVDVLVGALARLGSEPPIHLLLMGDGPERESALAAARRVGLESRVTAIGAVPPEDLPGWVAACDVGVVPGSNDYGQPMKLLDYAAAGLPALAPDLAPVREVIDPGVTGLLFPPGDEAALAIALARLAGDPVLRRVLGARARSHAEAASWRGRARELIALAAGAVPEPAGGARPAPVPPAATHAGAGA